MKFQNIMYNGQDPIRTITRLAKRSTGNQEFMELLQILDQLSEDDQVIISAAALRIADQLGNAGIVSSMELIFKLAMFLIDPKMKVYKQYKKMQKKEGNKNGKNSA
jgi:hypothetical protein